MNKKESIRQPDHRFSTIPLISIFIGLEEEDERENIANKNTY